MDSMGHGWITSAGVAEGLPPAMDARPSLADRQAAPEIDLSAGNVVAELSANGWEASASPLALTG